MGGTGRQRRRPLTARCGRERRLGRCDLAARGSAGPHARPSGGRHPPPRWTQPPWRRPRRPSCPAQPRPPLYRARPHFPGPELPNGGRGWQAPPQERWGERRAQRGVMPHEGRFKCAAARGEPSAKMRNGRSLPLTTSVSTEEDPSLSSARRSRSAVCEAALPASAPGPSPADVPATATPARSSSPATPAASRRISVYLFCFFANPKTSDSRVCRAHFYSSPKVKGT